MARKSWLEFFNADLKWYLKNNCFVDNLVDVIVTTKLFGEQSALLITVSKLMESRPDKSKARSKTEVQRIKAKSNN